MITLLPGTSTVFSTLSVLKVAGKYTAGLLTVLSSYLKNSGSAFTSIFNTVG